MKRKELVAVVLGMTLTLPVWAAEQQCDAAISETAPMSRFKETGQGVLKDKELNKVWLRCSLGMRWNGSSCEGQTLTYTWRDARAAIEELNSQQVGGRSNWRFPTIDELASIVESRCFKPAINLDVFPYSPESGFWSDTAEEGVQPRVWIIHFLHGQRYIANKKQNWRVRPIADK